MKNSKVEQEEGQQQGAQKERRVKGDKKIEQQQG